LAPVGFSNNQEPEKAHSNKGGREKKLPPGMYKVILEMCYNYLSTFMSITPCRLAPAEGLNTPSLINFNKNLHRSQALGLMPVIPATLEAEIGSPFSVSL
jgi:hypothetical protein